MRISRDRLSIEVITDCWSQEIDPRTSREELLDFLEAAWWRGQLKTDGPLTPLALLKSMYKSANEGDLPTLVFVTKEDAILPKGIELPDGSLQLDDNDLKPRIVIPSYDPETWTKDSCAPAFEAMAQKASRKHYPDRTIQFMMMEIDHEEFVRFLIAHGIDLPKFWRPLIEEPSELHEKAQSSTNANAHRKQALPVRLEVRKRGRAPVKLEAVKQAMRRDIREGRLNLASLSEKLEKNLAEVYCVSRDTARKARDAVLVAQAMWRDIRDGRRSPASLGAMSEKELEETYGVSRHIASKERAAVLSEINEEPICDK
jgi:hypothetical protein